MNNHTSIKKNLSSSNYNNPYYNWKETKSFEEIKPCCFINIDINNCFPCCTPVVPKVPLPPNKPNLPIPPDQKPKGGFGKFKALPQKVYNGYPYEFKKIAIQGDKIIYEPEKKTIVLKSKTIFRYYYMADTILRSKVPSNLENILVLNFEEIPLSGSKANNVEPGVLISLQSKGEFITEEDENILWLLYYTNPEVHGLTSATLIITEVTK